ncbi:hypothetical protein [Shewanella algae]|uniref:hypothetical protein n=1 Tax=Shewanella algae TaxID=38313 RepID=UPI001C595CE0|nr:hypothetical protein [Shewanella algae]
MIRSFAKEDMYPLLEIWLTASIDAHDFIAADFWQSQLDNMRRVYIPAAENYVYQHGAEVLGFYSLYENSLAALFVKPALLRNSDRKPNRLKLSNSYTTY